LTHEDAIATGRFCAEKNAETRQMQTVLQILVMAFAPGTLPETVSCACNADFIVYGTTNAGVLSNTPGCGYSISVKSTGAGIGSISPTFVIGAVLATRSPFI
jgi:hypothetical protein